MVFALRVLQEGEEVTCDYTLPLSGEAAKILCHCGAPECRGFFSRPAPRH